MKEYRRVNKRKSVKGYVRDKIEFPEGTIAHDLEKLQQAGYDFKEEVKKKMEPFFVRIFNAIVRWLKK